MRLTRDRVLGLLTTLVALGMTPADARADSDGYYCVGPDYLAYQLRSWHWFNFGQHRLTVVRFGPEGLRWLGSIDLRQDFQPHSMRCGGEDIQLEGWALGYLRVNIELGAGTELRIGEVTRDADRAFSPADYPEQLPNLGDWSRPGTTTLFEADYGRIDLVVDHRRIDGQIGCTEVNTRLRLVRPARSAELHVYRGFLPCEGGSAGLVHPPRPQGSGKALPAELDEGDRIQQVHWRLPACGLSDCRLRRASTAVGTFGRNRG